jgi:hypothetical protein
MRGTHWGQGYNRPTGCSAEKSPYATFNPTNERHCERRSATYGWNPYFQVIAVW